MKERQDKKQINKKRLIIIIIAALAAAAAAAVLIIYFRRGRVQGDDINVTEVAALMGEGSEGGGNRFAGVAESKQSWQVNLDAGNSVGKIYVSVGDSVKKGDRLFSYDTNKLSETRTQAEIDLQRLQNERTSYNNALNGLKKEKGAAGAADQGSYTIRIQEQELALKQKDIEIKEKSKELAKIKAAVKDATVKSKIDGVVKSINRPQDTSSEEGDIEDEEGDIPYEGETGETAFMTIMQTSALQIKASANEQNVTSLEEGATVTVHSRVDDTEWKGKITKIDFDTPKVNTQEDAMMEEEESGSEETSSSTYPFYVELESSEGLMLGQHVYVEQNNGQEDRDGIWLDEVFIVDVDGDPYVLAESGRGKLQKRSVTIGDYDEERMQYEITEGLTKKDRIAMPNAAEEE